MDMTYHTNMKRDRSITFSTKNYKNKNLVGFFKKSNQIKFIPLGFLMFYIKNLVFHPKYRKCISVPE